MTSTQLIPPGYNNHQRFCVWKIISFQTCSDVKKGHGKRRSTQDSSQVHRRRHWPTQYPGDGEMCHNMPVQGVLLWHGHHRYLRGQIRIRKCSTLFISVKQI